MTSSKPNDLPEAPPPNTNTLEVRASIYEFEGAGDTNILPIACGNLWDLHIKGAQ